MSENDSRAPLSAELSEALRQIITPMHFSVGPRGLELQAKVAADLGAVETVPAPARTWAEVLAIIATGNVQSCVDTAAAEALGLPVTEGRCRVHVELPSRLRIDINAMVTPLAPGVAVALGRDALAAFDLTYSGPARRWSLALAVTPRWSEALRTPLRCDGGPDGNSRLDLSPLGPAPGDSAAPAEGSADEGHVLYADGGPDGTSTAAAEPPAIRSQAPS